MIKRLAPLGLATVGMSLLVMSLTGCQNDQNADNAARLPPPTATAPVKSPEDRAAESRAANKAVTPENPVSPGAMKGDGR